MKFQFGNVPVHVDFDDNRLFVGDIPIVLSKPESDNIKKMIAEKLDIPQKYAAGPRLTQVPPKPTTKTMTKNQKRQKQKLSQSEYWDKLKADKAAKGECLFHKRPPAPGKMLCEECIDNRRQR